MRNRDEVIKEFEDIYLGYIPTNEDEEYRDALYKDVLRLLKEQEPVVRCRECKWHEMRGEMLLCKAQDKPHTYDWYCADGEWMDDRPC